MMVMIMLMVSPPFPCQGWIRRESSSFALLLRRNINGNGFPFLTRITFKPFAGVPVIPSPLITALAYVRVCTCACFRKRRMWGRKLRGLGGGSPAEKARPQAEPGTLLAQKADELIPRRCMQTQPPKVVTSIAGAGFFSVRTQLRRCTLQGNIIW